MKRFIAVMGALLAAALVFYEFGTVAICDGWYDLTVKIDAEVSRGVTHVSYVGAYNAEIADSYIEIIDELTKSVERYDAATPVIVSVDSVFALHLSVERGVMFRSTLI